MKMFMFLGLCTRHINIDPWSPGRETPPLTQAVTGQKLFMFMCLFLFLSQPTTGVLKEGIPGSALGNAAAGGVPGSAQGNWVCSRAQCGAMTLGSAAWSTPIPLSTLASTTRSTPISPSTLGSIPQSTS